MKKLCLIIAIAILMYSGCGLFGGKTYYPLTVGNIWKYSMQTVTIDSVRTDTTTSQTTTSITGTDKLADDREAFVVTSTTGSGSYTSYMLEDGDYILAFDSKTDSMPDTVLAQPLEDGKSWTVNSFPTIGKFTASVTGQEDVTVEAGDYSDCWIVKYSYDNNPSIVENKSWFAKNVGTVKSYVETKITMIGYTVVTKTTTELTEFTEK